MLGKRYFIIKYKNKTVFATDEFIVAIYSVMYCFTKEKILINVKSFEKTTESNNIFENKGSKNTWKELNKKISKKINSLKNASM